MPGDATILEGPVTPAPLFAYRAIRSIFFASPDSSPEHYNKENLVPVHVTSPTKAKSALPASPQLTPSQKRKREAIIDGGVVLSPTKGILRTPGLATPRAKYLKDVNVKFKSVSPEVRRTNAIVKNTNPSQPKAQNALEAIRPAKSTAQKATAKQPPNVEGLVTNTSTNELAAADPICPFAPTAIEAYMAQTEKEMKRLIRYGKKMREYALKKDVENQELKMMIEELRGEKERHKTTSTKPSRDTYTTNLASHLKPSSGGQPQKHNSEETHIKSKAISPALRNKNRGHVREEVDRVETTVKVQASKDLQSQRKSSDPTKPDTDPSRMFPDVQWQSSIKTTNPAFASVSGIPSRNDGSQDAEVPVTSLPIITATTNNGTLRLAPDRAAAARERLRKRSEARKTSAESVAMMKDEVEDVIVKQPVPRETTTRRDSIDFLDEPSVDWANL